MQFDPSLHPELSPAVSDTQLILSDLPRFNTGVGIARWEGGGSEVLEQLGNFRSSGTEKRFA
jgi:hypothetical protein